MILVDTSVWVEHLRAREPELERRLQRAEVLMHPCVLGELALGNLRNREALLADLGRLPMALTATHEEVLGFIRALKLHGRGIGYVDAHLLAAALLSEAKFWTLDRRLAGIADELLLSIGRS